MNNFLGFPLNPYDALNNIEIMLEAGLLLSSTTNDEISELGVTIIDLAKRYSAEVSLGFTKKINEVTQIDKPEISHQNSFASRLRLALSHSGMTQTTLAGLIGVSQGTVSAMVTGKSKEAGIARCGKIAQILGINAGWLRYGEGEMTSFNFSR
ncbi:helix-turn-helix transcriptional regulator [Providencia rettgeri]|uniref:helix-turn-helix domain-containing protein n=1 Tax=Providencia rettgeri TaxID=587 RepID=UPI0019D4CBC3|nr:helix-turn-helix transcriptional regulator [Providencia rettgeri]ELR5224450.1 helix-turn-helix transcriptional regulator [Providencia rettgeri]MBN7840896.1 helix-turn-helix transcriptional regulator [Providencia rettgeri]MBN7855746.1 helix-turn-helix transcriptional regulator [Providencia rettgeri]MBN7860979.1 helix-turn-helix transcriptional regulator [Providencia rettgeri]MBN7874030.1 helix-turn-helix transcriptional regulator [Providencia rettgeri]